MRLRKYTRKGRCSECGNSSTHSKKCLYAYIPEPDSKSRYKFTFLDKLKIIIKILSN